MEAENSVKLNPWKMEMNLNNSAETVQSETDMTTTQSSTTSSCTSQRKTLDQHEIQMKSQKTVMNTWKMGTHLNNSDEKVRSDSTTSVPQNSSSSSSERRPLDFDLNDIVEQSIAEFFKMQKNSGNSFPLAGSSVGEDAKCGSGDAPSTQTPKADSAPTPVPSSDENFSEKAKMRVCHICGANIKYLSNFSRHMKAHRDDGSKPHVCLQCGASFNRPYGLQRHMLTHSEQKPYQCSMCDLSYSESRNLRVHMMRKHNVPLESPQREPPKNYFCAKCDMGFRSEEELSNHKQMHLEKKPFKCVECGCEFGYRNSWRRHMRNHLNVRPFPCTECEKSFTRSDHLELHLKTHKIEREEKVGPQYVCMECGQIFARYDTFNTHLAAHASAKINEPTLTEPINTEPSLNDYPSAESTRSENKREKEMASSHDSEEDSNVGTSDNGRADLSQTNVASSGMTVKLEPSTDSDDSMSENLNVFFAADPNQESSHLGSNQCAGSGDPISNRFSGQDADISVKFGAGSFASHNVKGDNLESGVFGCEGNVDSSSVSEAHWTKDRSIKTGNGKSRKVRNFGNSRKPYTVRLKGKKLNSISKDLRQGAQRVGCGGDGGAVNGVALLDFDGSVDASSESNSAQNNNADDDGGERFDCSMCDKVFATYHHLSTHLKVHEDRESFPCPSCEAVYTQRTSLKRHVLERHSGRDPYSCPHCPASFVRSDRLRRHMQKHAVEKAFKCLECGESFSYASSLRRHQNEKHSGIRPYMCGLCNSSYLRPDHLKTHMMKKHGTAS